MESLVTTKELIDVLTQTFSLYIKEDIVDKHPAVFIKGVPGVGKSQAILKIKNNLKTITNKEIVLKDVRLLLYSPLDLNGIPVPDKEKKKAIWLTPELFSFENEDAINILFLDELTSAPEQIQAAAYQIALDKKLGDHKLPKNTFVVAAGNTNDDYSVTNEMPTALKNRFIHFKIKEDVESWINWALENKIHNYIIEFIKKNPDKLITKEFNTDSNIIVTPRSYEILSNMLNILKGDIKEHETIIKSVLGESLTKVFLNNEEEEEVYNYKKILNEGINEEIKDLEIINKILTNLEISYKNYFENKEQMENVLSFIKHIPKDFALRYIKRVLNNPPHTYNIFNINIFEEMINSFSDIDYE